MDTFKLIVKQNFIDFRFAFSFVNQCFWKLLSNENFESGPQAKSGGCVKFAAEMFVVKFGNIFKKLSTSIVIIVKNIAISPRSQNVDF